MKRRLKKKKSEMLLESQKNTDKTTRGGTPESRMGKKAVTTQKTGNGRNCPRVPPYRTKTRWRLRGNTPRGVKRLTGGEPEHLESTLIRTGTTDLKKKGAPFTIEGPEPFLKSLGERSSELRRI